MPRSKKSSSAHPGKSVVVTGASGFLSRRLLLELEKDARYSRVIAVDHIRPPVSLKKTKFYKLDLTETMADAALAEILREEGCDVLVHGAFPMSPPQDQSKAHELVAIGSYYVFNACAAAKVKKVLMTSSTDVYGAFPTNPNYLSEEASPRGHLQDRLLADRIDAEKQAQAYQKKHSESVVSILRFATLLGPTVESHKTRYLRRLVVPSVLGFDPLMQFLHEDDAIAALVHFLNEDHRGVFNVAGNGVLPLSQVIDACGALALPLPLTVFKAMAQTLWYADMSPAPASHVDFLRYLCVADSEKIRRVGGFKPKHTSREALMSFVAAKRVQNLSAKNVANGAV